MTTEAAADKALGVAVITPVGVFPNDDDYRRAFADEKIEKVLKETAAAQHLTNTEGWVAKVKDRPVSPDKTFEQEGLSCVVEIEWHKPEGGGGARGDLEASV